jgi:hypothetical protein
MRRALAMLAIATFANVLVVGCGPNPPAAVCSNPVAPNLSGGTGAGHMDNFASDYVSAPVTGAGEVTNADFTNIFLFPDPSSETWDQHLASLSDGGASTVDSAASSETLDAITKALTCSSYFDLLTQYNINPPTFSGAESTTQSCVDAAVHDAGSHGKVISYKDIRDFAACVKPKSSVHSDQVNIFVSPDLKVAPYGQTSDMCSSSSSTHGYHGWGFGVPNWTVIPINTGCNSNLSSVTEDLSHEMVELVSDPAGAGWVHESLPARILTISPANLEEEFGEGELADICKSGLFPTLSTVFPADPATGLGSLTVAPYWSDQDDACEPQAIADQTIATFTGSPLVRFTGSVHNLVVPISVSAALASDQIEALELVVVTGGDNLNSGSAANATAQFSAGLPISSNGLNEGAEWGDHTEHAALLQFPHGMELGQLKSILLNTQFGGGLFGDNWNVNEVIVRAAVGPQPKCAPTSAQLVAASNLTKLSDGSQGLVRMTGSTHSFSLAVSADASIASRIVDDLQLTVGTGGDDLRGGSSPSDNASAVIALGSGVSVAFPNINQSSKWANSSSHTVDLSTLNSLPSGTTAGALSMLTLTTDFGGGLSGDNWDVNTLSLTASLGCPSPASPGPTSVSSGPTTIQLLYVAGRTPLADGSTGLARLTGDDHSLTELVPSVPASEKSDVVVALYVEITTGDDDLRGGSDGGDNATVGVGSVSFPDVNQTQTWGNDSAHTVNLTPLPPAILLGDVSSVNISTMFGGGINGDNWDIFSIRLEAVVVP